MPVQNPTTSIRNVSGLPQLFTFPNGVRLVYEKTKNNIPITSIHAFCTVGSIHEPDNLRGVAHMIEHMCFKGTTKIPKSKDLFIEYDKIGADFNAVTTKTFTCYLVKCEDNYAGHCIDIVSDMMMNSLFALSGYKTEHKVVMEENINSENDQTDIILRESDRLLYNGSAYQYPVDVLDYHKKSSSLPRNEVFDFYHKQYTPNNMVISVVSNISFDKIKRFIMGSQFMKNHIGHDIGHGTVPINSAILPQSEIQYKIIKKAGITNTLISIAFRICGNNHIDKPCVELLKMILSGTMSGRLFMILRELNGLTYSSDVFTEYFDHFGGFTVFTQTDTGTVFKNDKKPGVLPILISILNDLIKNGVTKEELEIVKGNLKGSTLIDMEDNDTQCMYNGTELLSKKNEPIIPYSKTYDVLYKPVTCEDIHKIIVKYLTPINMSVCLLNDSPPSLSKVKSEFSKFSV